MKISTRNCLPTKAALYRIADAVNVTINSLDNRSKFDHITWQHHNLAGIHAFIKVLTDAGFAVTEPEPYRPKELRTGSFHILPRQ